MLRSRVLLLAERNHLNGHGQRAMTQDRAATQEQLSARCWAVRAAHQPHQRTWYTPRILARQVSWPRCSMVAT